MSAARVPRKRAAADTDANGLPNPGSILTPDALPMFKDDDRLLGKTGKRKRERERHDPKLTQKPMPPVTGPGRGGRVGASATQHVVQNLVKDSTRDQDPREALLKYADKGDGSSIKWTGAWAKTQPKAIFDENPEPEPEMDETGKRKERKTTTGAGLK